MNKVYWSLAFIGLVLILMTIGANYSMKPFFYTLANSTEDEAGWATRPTVDNGEKQDYSTRFVEQNQKIQCDNREIVVISANTYNEYLIVIFKIKNTSSGPIGIKRLDFQLQDEQGSIYNPEVGLHASGYNILNAVEDLNPGVTKQLTLIFSVADSNRYALIYPSCDVTVNL